MSKIKGFVGDAIIVMLSAIVIIPLILMFTNSLKTNVDMLSEKFLNFQPTLSGWRDVLFAPATVKALGGNWPLYYWNSVQVSVLSTGIALALGLPAAYALARFPLKRKNFTAFSLLSTRLIPPITFLVPAYLMILYLHLQTTILSVVIFYVIFQIPFVVWIMRGFIEEVPRVIEESASIDGASTFYTFADIVLPLAKDGLVVTCVLAFLQAWNEYLLGQIFLSGPVQTIPVAAAHLADYQLISWNQVFVIGIIASIPPVILGLLVQRYLVRGLTLGMVKG